MSGYRSPVTNDRLRRRNSAAAKGSFHVKGKAVDIRIPGYSTNAVRRVALDLKQGGVGYYPRSRYVHIDTGPVRSCAAGIRHAGSKSPDAGSWSPPLTVASKPLTVPLVAGRGLPHLEGVEVPHSILAFSVLRRPPGNRSPFPPQNTAALPPQWPEAPGSKWSFMCLPAVGDLHGRQTLGLAGTDSPATRRTRTAVPYGSGVPRCGACLEPSHRVRGKQRVAAYGTDVGGHVVTTSSWCRTVCMTCRPSYSPWQPSMLHFMSPSSFVPALPTWAPSARRR